MSGRIPGNSQNPYQYSAYPERPSSRQSNTQGNSMQRPPSRSGGFSTSQMYSALPRLQTSFGSHPSSSQSVISSGNSDMYYRPRQASLSRPGSSGAFPSTSHPSSPQSAISSGNGDMYYRPRQSSLSRPGSSGAFPSHSSIPSAGSSRSSGMYIPSQFSSPHSGSLYNMPPRPLSRSGTPSSYNRASGPELTDVRQLPPDERERFLNQHDPMRFMRGLNANTSLYRSTERRYVSNGRIQGNPNSCAIVERHDKLVPNVMGRQFSNAPIGTARAYSPAQGYASELGPSLNVMVGSAARNIATRYSANPNSITVKMKLGDFLQRGGRVYLDVGSAVAGNADTVPLIVTLPAGQSVPFQTVE